MNNKKIEGIQCTQCNAPLSLHGGGHKIKSLTCQYCGTVMDAHNDFKVLAQFSEQQKPANSPLSMGMQGRIKGIHFTVIGIIEWYSEGSQWIDYQIFSSTHGYAWLVHDRGHWIFLRRTRHLPSKSLWSISLLQSFTAQERKFRLYERFNAQITYVVGELTWIARVGDQTQLAEAIAPPYIFSEERSDKETEFYFGEYIDALEIESEFGADKKYPASKMHPLKPYQSKVIAPLAKAAKPFAWLSLFVSLLIIFFMHGNTVDVQLVTTENINNEKVQLTYEFPVKKTKQLIILQLDTHSAGDLFDFLIKKKNTTRPLLQLGSNNTKGSEKNTTFIIKKKITSVRSQFNVTKAGVYQLSFIEKKTNITQNKFISKVKIKIKEGYVSAYYFTLLLIFSLLIIFVAYLFRLSFESARWRASGVGS